MSSRQRAHGRLSRRLTGRAPAPVGVPEEKLAALFTGSIDRDEGGASETFSTEPEKQIGR